MKTVFLLFFVVLCLHGKATNYYFSSNTGSDSRTPLQASSQLTPWKTIEKLNAFSVNLRPGDSVLFKRGEFFSGSISVRKSGIAGLPIVYSAYGLGNKPVITGFASIPSWKSLGSGIYESTAVVAKPDVNMVVINDSQFAMGRYPNSGFLTYESFAANSSIIDNQLLGDINWTGSEVVIRKNPWIIDRNLVLSQIGGTVNYKTSSTHRPTKNYGYFFQNSPKTLDQFGEWYVNPSTRALQVFFGSKLPQSYSVKLALIDTLMYVNGANFISVVDLAFQGSNKSTLQIVLSSNIRIKDCNIDFSGSNAIRAFTTRFLTIEGCGIRGTNNNAISLGMSPVGSCTDVLIKNNFIGRTGIIPGMGNSGDGTYQGIFTDGNNVVIEQNVIDSTGHNGVNFTGNFVSIKNNKITNFTLSKDDGGGIYSYKGGIDKTIFHSRSISGNIIALGKGTAHGHVPDPSELKVHGIYLDDNASGIEIFENTITECAGSGLFFHNAHEITARSNTFYNNECQVKFTQDDPAITSSIRNVVFKGNKAISKLPSQRVMQVSSVRNDIDSMFISDSNYFVRPFDDNIVFNTVFRINGSQFQKSFNLTGWQAEYNEDRFSKKSPKQFDIFQAGLPIGLNRFGNEHFDLGTTGSSAYNNVGSMKVSNVVKLDGKALQGSYTDVQSSGSSLLAFWINGGIVAGKTYVSKFSSLGTKTSALRVFVRQASSNLELANHSYKSLSPIRTENEIIFKPTISEAGAVAVIATSQKDSTLWIDNVRFHETTVQLNDPDLFLKFETNYSNVAKSIPLNGTYMDLNGQLLSNTATVPAFSSLFLLKHTVQPTTSAQPAQVAFSESSTVSSDERILPGGIQLYPNPVRNVLTLIIPNGDKTQAIRTAQLYDMKGRLLKVIPFNELARRHSINVSALLPGLYSLSLCDASGRIVYNQSWVKLP